MWELCSVINNDSALTLYFGIIVYHPLVRLSHCPGKIPWNTQKTPTKHVLRLFKKFLKIRFSAQKSGSRPRCRTMLEILWNTQKTPTKHALRHFKKFLKIRFLAEKSGSRLICRIMLKYHETLRNHQLNMFWGFLKNSWKSGPRLKNPVLG